jgi:hypothetical protein
MAGDGDVRSGGIRRGEPTFDGVDEGVARGGRSASSEEEGVIAASANEGGGATGVATQAIGFEPFEELAPRQCSDSAKVRRRVLRRSGHTSRAYGVEQGGGEGEKRGERRKEKGDADNVGIG